MIKYLLSYAPAKLITGLLSFTSLMLFARIFTTNQYGNYSYTFSVISLVSSVIFVWIRMSSFRYFNTWSQKMGKTFYISYIFGLTFFLSVFFIATLLFLRVLGFGSISNLFLVAAIASVVNVFFEQVLSLNRADLESRSFMNYSILNPILKIAIVLILVLILGLNEMAIFVSVIISGTLIVFFYLNKLKKQEKIYIKIKNPFKEKEITGEFLRYGFPLTFSFLFSIILASSDRIIIKHLIDENAVALYSMGYDITTFIIGNIFMILNFTFIPVIMKMIDNRRHLDAKKNIQNYFWILNFVLLPIVLFICFFAPYIAGYILGNQYSNPHTMYIIQLMAIGAYFSGIKAYFFDFSFQFGKKTSIQIVPIATGAVLNIILNLLIIPIYGLNGAVYSTIFSYIVSLIISIILGKKAYWLSINLSEIFTLFLQIAIIFIVLFAVLKSEAGIYPLMYNLLIFIVLMIFYLIFNLNRVKKVLK